MEYYTLLTHFHSLSAAFQWTKLSPICRRHWDILICPSYVEKGILSNSMTTDFSACPLLLCWLHGDISWNYPHSNKFPQQCPVQSLPCQTLPLPSNTTMTWSLGLVSHPICVFFLYISLISNLVWWIPDIALENWRKTSSCSCGGQSDIFYAGAWPPQSTVKFL